MNRAPLIQIRNSGRMWQIMLNGTVRAFACTYRAAQTRAIELVGGAA